MDSAPARRPPASLAGVSLTMFLIFTGFSAAQFHGYLFERLGFDALQIGCLLAAGYGAGIVSPLLQVSIIRRFHGPRLPLIAALAGAALLLALLPFARGFAPMLLLFIAFSLCNSAIFPLNSACTFEVLRGLAASGAGRPAEGSPAPGTQGRSSAGSSQFFRVRTLGTAGFMVGCLISAFFPNPSELPWLYAGFAAALGLALAVVLHDYRRVPPEEAPEDILVNPHPSAAPTFARALELLRDPFTLRLLICLGVMNFANALATAVQGNYLVHRFAEGQRAISIAWVVSTLCEIPVMLYCARAVKTRGLPFVLALGLFGTLLKLIGLAAATQLWQFYLALALHGFMFAGAITGMSVHIDRTFRKQDSPALQSLAVVFYQGLPLALAGGAAGLLWHAFSLRTVYLASGAIALVISGYAFFVLRARFAETP